MTEQKEIKNINRKRFFTTIGLTAFAAFVSTTFPFSLLKGKKETAISINKKLKVESNPLAVKRVYNGRKNGA